ncbi:MAG: hypothetical protein H7282_10390 [Cytophagaceae bacterium]|nr:hypothetical protein [Cytophagaceae bacterium]
MNTINRFDALIEKFNLTSLEKSAWTHDAHLIVALWHIKNLEFADAICQLRSKIILLNHFHGTSNTKETGYHETLTVFWAKTIAAYIKKHPTFSFEETVDSFLNSSFAIRELPFEFYKREEILSSDYRAVYHESTLKKLKE